MRPDGKRVKALYPMYEVVPFIMPKRYDAQNMVNIQLDEDVIRDYLREKRRDGVRMDHMTVLIAAYLRTCAKYPVLNRFVMNRRIYQRNHFCVCFVALKKRPDGSLDETVLKVYLDPSDDIFTVHKKMQDVIRKNAEESYDSSFDKFVHAIISVPGLVRVVVGLATFLDHHGLLPRKIIDISPFHTSLFVTNLASINTNYIYHHLYEFGTTSLFVAMGKIIRDYRNNRDDKHVMPLGIVMDERIASGYDFSRMMVEMRKYMRNPSLLEQPYNDNSDSVDADESEEVGAVD